ncbi:MAG: phosphonoacetaldehyde reductase [Erysipelotrichaceae bacterium]|nr:phosphonoacetaldehyde reductase [Erysipelotrichaceae bacterium]
MKPLTLPTHLHFMDPLRFIETMILKTKGQKCALFLSESAAKRYHFEPMIERLSKTSQLTWIKTSYSTPDYHDLASTLRSLKGLEFDVFIAIGGGSCLDLAKSTAAFIDFSKDDVSDEDLLKIIKDKTYLSQTTRPQLIAVPTTAGSGSELTRWAILWDFDHEEKLSIETPHLAFDEAYIVVEFTLSMPLKLTLSTGLDALTQASEAYWAKSTTPSVQVLALQAIRLIVRNLPRVLADPYDYEFRKNMMIGSILGAMAFSNTKTTACHSISYPLTLKFKMDHGLACALTLGDILRHNLSALSNPESVYEAFNINNPEQVTQWIEKLSEGIVSMRLSDYGVKESDLETLAHLSFTLGRMENNPIDLNEQQVQDILKLHL